MNVITGAPLERRARGNFHRFPPPLIRPWLYACIKYRRQPNNFNLNMHTHPPSSIDSSTQLAS